MALTCNIGAAGKAFRLKIGIATVFGGLVLGWFLTTDVPNGLKHFVRTPMSTGMDGDFDTGNSRYKARERYSFGVSDSLGMFGSSGSTT